MLIKDTGQTGLFYDYKGLVEANKEKILNVLESKPDLDFVNNTLTGGTTFNSTEYFIKYIEQCL